MPVMMVVLRGGGILIFLHHLEVLLGSLQSPAIGELLSLLVALA